LTKGVDYYYNLKTGTIMTNLIIQQTIPIIFKQILKDKTNGELIVRGLDFQKNLFFIGGNLVRAKTTVPEERLGHILYRCGKISAPQLKDIPALISDRNEKIGKILVQNNMLTQRDVFDGLGQQIITIAVSLFSVTYGEWDFFKKVPKLPEDSRFKIKLPGIIKEGMKIAGHIAFFENEFYYQRPKTGIIPHSVSKYLSAEEKRFYKELSTFGSIQVGRIIKALNISEEAFWKKINLFYLLNILDFDETTGSFEDTAVAVDQKVVEIIQEALELYETLMSNKINYYGLLKVTKETNPDELKTSFRTLYDRYNPVSLNVTQEINEKIKFVFSKIRKAFEILSNKEKRREYDWECFEKRVTEVNGHSEEAAGEEEEKLNPDVARREAEKLFTKAESLYKQRKYMEASILLEKVVKLDNSNISYSFLLGLSQLEIPLLRRKAEKTLLDVAGMDPRNAEPLYALGLLYRAGDMPKKAEVFFRKALEINIDHTLAGKMLHEIEDIDESAKKKSFFTIFGKK
jgi:tetratricopeptide (TPR) repeat protein